MKIKKIAKGSLYGCCLAAYFVLSALFASTANDLFQKEQKGAGLFLILTGIVVATPLVLLVKGIREEMKAAVDQMVTHWFDTWWLPLTKAVKRRFFWQTRVYVVSNSLYHLAGLFFLVFLLPRFTVGFSHSKDWIAFLSYSQLILVLLCVGAMFLSLGQQKMKKVFFSFGLLGIILCHSVVSAKLVAEGFLLADKWKASSFIQYVLFFILLGSISVVGRSRVKKRIVREIHIEPYLYFMEPQISFGEYNELLQIVSVCVDYPDLSEMYPSEGRTNAVFKIKVNIRYSFTELTLFYVTPNVNERISESGMCYSEMIDD